MLLTLSSTSHGAVAMLVAREGNRRFGVAQAMRQRLCDISVYRLNCLRRADEQPIHSSIRDVAPLTFWSLASLTTALSSDELFRQ